MYLDKGYPGQGFNPGSPNFQTEVVPARLTYSSSFCEHGNEQFEFLTAVGKNNSVFWDITPCSSLLVKRRFGGIYRLHLQGRRISQVRNQHEASSKKDGGEVFLRNVC
jgi:hypothetical protein